jgi:hypothetical protein
MGRVTEKHPRYRTKDEIVRDVTFVLNSPLSYGTKWAVLRDVAWVWTEFYGKYKGCPYWTKTALMQHRVNPKADFRHEHAVPKAVVMKMLLDLSAPTPEQVREICERLLVGVVVTREEDNDLNMKYGRSMPAEFFNPASPSYRDPWLRYKRLGIEVVDLTDQAACRENGRL